MGFVRVILLLLFIAGGEWLACRWLVGFVCAIGRLLLVESR